MAPTTAGSAAVMLASVGNPLQRKRHWLGKTVYLPGSLMAPHQTCMANGGYQPDRSGAVQWPVLQWLMRQSVHWRSRGSHRWLPYVGSFNLAAIHKYAVGVFVKHRYFHCSGILPYHWQEHRPRLYGRNYVVREEFCEISGTQ